MYGDSSIRRSIPFMLQVLMTAQQMPLMARRAQKHQMGTLSQSRPRQPQLQPMLPGPLPRRGQLPD